MKYQNTIEDEFYIYVDIESTGFDPIRNDVTSIGIVVADYELNVLQEKYILSRPEINKFTSEEALQVSNFTIDEVLSHQSREDAAKELLSFLSEYKRFFPQKMVSHAIGNFDWRFIDWLFRKENMNYELYKILNGDLQISTIKMAREQGHEKNKLNLWADKLGIKFNHHNSLSDAKLCYEVHKYLSGLHREKN